jgi:hypothetical protein
VGFYGGINYGFGYFGNGFEGGRWQDNHFYYNTAVVHVNETIIHNTYRTTIVETNRSRVAFNGGQGGLNYRATAEQERFASERHVDAVEAQRQHVEAARGNPALRASANQGKPPIAATARAGDFKGGTVAAREAGGEYHAPPANAARGGQENRPANDTRKATYNHASEVQQHQFTPPNTGNAKTDAKYQQQQQKLAAKQNQQHVKLQQQQDKEHQQAEKRQANDTQKAAMEQRHTQQTQHLEQQHTQQQTHMEQRQAPRPSGGGGGGSHRP